MRCSKTGLANLGYVETLPQKKKNQISNDWEDGSVGIHLLYVLEELRPDA